MSRRTCEALLALTLAACHARAPALDVCAAGDGLAAALVGGQLRVEVRDADGTPRSSAVVALDRPSHAALGGAPDGAWVVVEGLDADGAPVAGGAATLAGGAACVCVSRTTWYSYASWQDAAGAYHDGPSADFVVQQAAPPGLRLARPLALDHARVQPGDVLRATAAYENRGAAAIDVRGLAVLARPPGATHAAGLVTDFSPVAVGRVQPGQVVDVDVTRAFGDADAPGTWRLFTRLVDRLGVAHDGPEVSLAVGGSDADPLVPAVPPTLDHAWVQPPDMLHVATSYRNDGTAPITIQQLILTTRPPGGSNAGGPFDDLSPRLGSTTIGPGQTIDVAAGRMFPAADDPCADVVCTVEAGACKLTPRTTLTSVKSR